MQFNYSFIFIINVVRLLPFRLLLDARMMIAIGIYCDSANKLFIFEPGATMRECGNVSVGCAIFGKDLRQFGANNVSHEVSALSNVLRMR